MSEKDKNTEEKIFESAQIVFLKKGFDGARMEEIAQEAGINKSLLHYYYRTKEKLFNAIFEKVLGYVVPRIVVTMENDIHLFTKIELFTETYIDTFLKNPYIPHFVLNELNRNPNNIAEIVSRLTGTTNNDIISKLRNLINVEIEKGTIREIEPEQLIVNIMSMCIFPFVARPVIQAVLFKNDKAAYREFLEKRKKEVAHFIIQSIKIEK